MTRPATDAPPRTSQVVRRERSQSALLESAAREFSRYGFGQAVLARVASEAGYTRGALYHVFASKDALALAVIAWVEEAWFAEVGRLFHEIDDPLEALIAVARGHVVFCRRDVARVMMTLRIEFGDGDHPVARAVAAANHRLLSECSALIDRAKLAGKILSEVPTKAYALAYLGLVEGLAINLARSSPFDTILIERSVRGLFAA